MRYSAIHRHTARDNSQANLSQPTTNARRLAAIEDWWHRRHVEQCVNCAVLRRLWLARCCLCAPVSIDRCRRLLDRPCATANTRTCRDGRGVNECLYVGLYSSNTYPSTLSSSSFASNENNPPVLTRTAT